MAERGSSLNLTGSSVAAAIARTAPGVIATRPPPSPGVSRARVLAPSSSRSRDRDEITARRIFGSRAFVHAKTAGGGKDFFPTEPRRRSSTRPARRAHRASVAEGGASTRTTKRVEVGICLQGDAGRRKPCAGRRPAPQTSALSTTHPAGSRVDRTRSRGVTPAAVGPSRYCRFFAAVGPTTLHPATAHGEGIASAPCVPDSVMSFRAPSRESASTGGDAASDAERRWSGAAGLHGEKRLRQPSDLIPCEYTGGRLTP